MFTRKFVNQPSFNWGHRPTFAGGYAVCYDTNTNQWGEKKEYPPVSQDENVEEVLFVLNGSIYMLLHPNFGSFSVLLMFKWNGHRFEHTQIFQNFETIRLSDSKTRVEAIACDGEMADVTFIVANINGDMHVFKLTSAGAMELLLKVPDDVNNMRGQAVSAALFGGKLFIFFGVHGCGFRWEKNRLIVVDVQNKTAQAVQIPGDFSDGPRCGFTGAHARGVHANEWIHVGGSEQVGMTGSKFCAFAWKLGELPENPEWKLVAENLPEGELAIVNGTVYSLTKEGTFKITA
ncbi:hypothetical protein WR25_03339 isoform C [Diploscapter pachys]|nr:hypothetical protein WR25_03339 isoform C [Diploscapter pachys]